MQAQDNVGLTASDDQRSQRLLTLLQHFAHSYSSVDNRRFIDCITKSDMGGY